MKKMTMFVGGMVSAGILGAGAYVMMNKKTRKKTEKFLNNVFDEMDTTLKNMQK